MDLRASLFYVLVEHYRNKSASTVHVFLPPSPEINGAVSLKLPPSPDQAWFN